MSDPLDLKRFIRTVENFPIDGISFRDITSLIETPEAFVKTCDELTKITKEFGANIIASIESRGFIFAGTIARDLSLTRVSWKESLRGFPPFRPSRPCQTGVGSLHRMERFFVEVLGRSIVPPPSQSPRTHDREYAILSCQSRMPAPQHGA